MEKYISLPMIYEQLGLAKASLALDRQQILHSWPLTNPMDLNVYGFAYLRAERVCIAAIQHSLSEIPWLPLDINAESQLSPDTRQQLARWIKAGQWSQPDEAMFGNSFVHALTRCALLCGADDAACVKLANHIGLLFRDLTFLVSSLHACEICAEFGLQGAELHNHENLSQTAFDLSLLTDELLMGEDEAEAQIDNMAHDEELADNQNQHQIMPPYLTLVPNPAAAFHIITE
jgi:hypothetical protein